MARAYTAAPRSRGTHSRGRPSRRSGRPHPRGYSLPGVGARLRYWLPLAALTLYAGWLAFTVASRAVVWRPLAATGGLGVVVALALGAGVCGLVGWAWLHRVRAAAARRQRARELAILSEREALCALSPAQFEALVADLLRHQGYRDVHVTGGAGDLAADIVCRDADGARVVVQCKRYRANAVTSPEMQTFIGMIYVHHHADYGLYVTTSTFTRAARTLAEQTGVSLITGVDLAASIHSWRQALA